MKTTKKVLPGKPGTKKLIEKYGDKLFCVRYRYDAEQKMKLKTIELIIEKSHWEKSLGVPQGNKTMFIRLDYGEIKIGIERAGTKESLPDLICRNERTNLSCEIKERKLFYPNNAK